MKVRDKEASLMTPILLLSYKWISYDVTKGVFYISLSFDSNKRKQPVKMTLW